MITAISAHSMAAHMTELAPVYDPKTYEKRWYQHWVDHKYFHASPTQASKRPYTILMPPPNVTSQLHMGHGTGYSIQDLMIRWRRMQGYNACWLPGTDHAGIATQMMVESALQREEGKSRLELGRDEFTQRLWDWNHKYGGIILEQFRSMGFSCDWDRVAFTMDEQLSKAVRYVFVRLFEEGLIYRGERLVNWDTALQTAVSDDEVESQEVNGHLWTFNYPLEDDPNQYIPIATTRPETMLGDSAVAVNPSDARYQHLIGKRVRLPLTDRLIPIIGDDYVKSEFGTGAVKITPAHDPNDFEVGRRHQLPFINVMNPNGTMNEQCPKLFQGLDRFDARKSIIKEMKRLELFVEEKSHRHAIPHSERSKTIIEPRLSHQWFVKMEQMARAAADAVRDDRVQFHPESWKKTYYYWLDNIKDWCISRQLWWGHRIPIWYCAQCAGVSTGIEDPAACSHCASPEIRQDEDVLDTWFSSWLWPLSPFGWPDKDHESKLGLRYFYPTDTLVTAPEIIFLWVARMIMVGLKFTGEVPFKHVYFNATVCDKKGRKFSKTLGNGIDPLEVVDKYGADAVRFTAVSLAPLGGRIKMDHGDFEQGARFVNKLWNASRFLLRYVNDTTSLIPLGKAQLDTPSKWLLTELKIVTAEFNRLMEGFRLNDAVSLLYHFIWSSFCDWSIESSKEALESGAPAVRDAHLSTLVYVLDHALRLAHPVMPFVTEEIWQKLPHHPDVVRPDSIVIADFPDAAKMVGYEEAHAEWSKAQRLVSGIRSVRAQSEISPKERLSITIIAQPAQCQSFDDNSHLLKRLAGLSDLAAGELLTRPRPALVVIDRDFQAYVAVEGIMDAGREKTRLAGEFSRIQKIVQGLQSKLSNQDFVARAPEDVVASTTEQVRNLSQQLSSLEENLKALS